MPADIGNVNVFHHEATKSKISSIILLGVFVPWW